MSGSDPSIRPLTVRNIHYTVNGLQLLSNVSLEFPSDGAITIVGANGAGKTLLLRICHGLLTPSQGQVHWSNPSRALKAGVQSMVFQRPVMLRRSAKENILFAMRACHVPANELSWRLNEALSNAKLSEMADRPARKLSGGEQQRLALARCLALQPEVLFLDEPTAHLDPVSISHVEELILLLADQGCQIVMVTHDLAQARRLGDYTLFMHEGKAEEFAETETFFNQPKSSVLSAFLKGKTFNYD
ncbi:MAG: ATP-binding cassette domain-containing protein [Acidiferrobacterales bacterium]|nr:ATP-binding cassette domain-containing protein [Acidiferrobacterales bacterium]